MIRATFAALSAAALFALPAAAQTPRQSILAELDTATRAVASRGFVPDARAIGRASLMGELPRGGSVRLELNLRAGRRYSVVAGCGPACDDLDLRAFAAGGADVLAEDVEADARPVLTFIADATGPHLLSVTMAGCRTEFCPFGLRILSR
ncbi:MAG TPA: hypothetical protein VK420_17640 [Longimicrobium sp.]|nr:hypothetical protein [Longimicrobium sp.]